MLALAQYWELEIITPQATHAAASGLVGGRSCAAGNSFSQGSIKSLLLVLILHSRLFDNQREI